MKEIPEDLLRFIGSLELNERLSVGDPEKEQEFFKKLLSFRVINPYGDIFTYDDRAILLCGISSIGKTTLMRKFKEELGDRIEILKEDFPILYWDGQSRPVTYFGDMGDVSDPFFVPIPYLEVVEEYELEAIVLLVPDSSRVITPISVLELQSNPLFSWNNLNQLTPELERILALSMKNVHIFQYGINSGYVRQENLNLTYRGVVSELDRLRK